MVQGFERAMAEYESHLTAPYDKGGALYVDEEKLEDGGMNLREDYELEQYFLERE